MTLPDLLIAISFIDLGVATFACYCWRLVHAKTRENKRLMTLSHRALDNYKKYRQSLLESNDALLKKVEQAETAAADAKAERDYKEKESNRWLVCYKKLDTQYKDLQVKHNHLVLQYNSLTKGADEMPT